MNIDNFINENNIVQKYNINFISNISDYTNMMLILFFIVRKTLTLNYLNYIKEKYLFLLIILINLITKIKVKYPRFCV